LPTPFSSIASAVRHLVAGSALVSLLGAAEAAGPARQHENCDRGWRFFLGDATGADRPEFSDAAWRKLNLPHDWSIEGTFDEQAPTSGSGGYLPTGIGWYRKTFTLLPEAQGKKVSVEFDGIYQDSDVWLNGAHLGRQPYGYTSFSYDLTPHLRPAGQPNVLAVRVDNSAQVNTRWYSGSGIYRHVWLTVTDPVHVAHWGTYVTTPAVSATSATVLVRTRMLNEEPGAVTATVAADIADADGRVVARGQDTATLVPGETELPLTFEVTSPHLWSVTAPNLYRLHTTLSVAGAVRDDCETTFGIRRIDYDVDRGLLLNGAPVKLLGVCLHHDGGAVGAAVPEAVLERRLRLMQAMGCTAIRCSHNPMAPEFYDLCDRLGLLVMDEAFDVWTIGKRPHGYADWFNDWYERDLTAMIRRDRNHPSIVMWSAGNEIPEQRTPDGPEVLGKLVKVFHREDPTRPVTAAMDNIFNDDGPAPAAFCNLLDVVGYNYVDRWLDRRETFFGPDRSSYPQRKFVGTEDAGTHEVRGRYDFRAIPAGTPARAEYATAMIRVEQLWKFALTHDYVTGHFLWTGIDYLGEAHWPAKSATSGAVDTCGFPKDCFYLYQSIFTDRPVLHLLPHWNWAGREGQVVPVVAYTNCDVVELTLNGRSLGAKAREFPRQGTLGGWDQYPKPQVFPTTSDLHLAWDVPFEPGVLQATGWKNGEKVCETAVHTAGPPAALVVEVDRTTLHADGRDVAHVSVTVVDDSGHAVPGADNLVRFAVTGDAAVIGVDNGDPASHESFKANERRAFAGRCLALVQSGDAAGEIRVTASAAGLKGATIGLHANAVDSPPSHIFH
jgi:beta-galactosidase